MEVVKQLYDVDSAKLNTLIRPHGRKKACMHLSRGCGALDIAKRIGII